MYSSRHLPKSPRSSRSGQAARVVSRAASDAGSAVTEFALLALPLCIMTISATNYAVNVYNDNLMRAGAISAARFASLADTSAEEASEYARRLCLPQSIPRRASCVVDITSGASPLAVAQFSYQPLSLLVYQPEAVIIRVSTALETPKR